MSTQAPIRCLMLPLSAQTLLVPTSMVREVLHYCPVTPAEDAAPEWLLGHLARADQVYPVVSLQVLCGWPLADLALKIRAVIIAGLGPLENQACAIHITDRPKIVTVAPEQLIGVSQSLPSVLRSCAHFAGETVYLLDAKTLGGLLPTSAHYTI